MLDFFTRKLLIYLYSLSKNGEYVVETISEIMTALKINLKEKNKLINSINFLKDKEYIKVKYFDEEEICFCLLTNSNIYLENINQNKKNNKNNFGKFVLKLILIFISAFLGSFTAIMLIHYLL